MSDVEKSRDEVCWEMKQAGKSNAEIAEATGDKRPWLAAARWEKKLKASEKKEEVVEEPPAPVVSDEICSEYDRQREKLKPFEDAALDAENRLHEAVMKGGEDQNDEPVLVVISDGKKVAADERIAGLANSLLEIEGEIGMRCEKPDEMLFLCRSRKVEATKADCVKVLFGILGRNRNSEE
jgi:hypothetical protein